MADFNEEIYSKEDGKREKKRNRISDIIAIILCLIAAMSIWLFAVNRDNSAQETSKVETEAVASRIISQI